MLFERSSNDPALFGILLGLQAAFYAFLFSERGPLAADKRAGSLWRAGVVLVCALAFFVGLITSFIGLAMNEPSPYVALIASSAVVVQAIAVGFLPLLEAPLRDLLKAPPLDPRLLLPRSTVGGFAIGVIVMLILLLTGALKSEGSDAPILPKSSYAAVPRDPSSAEHVRARQLAVVICGSARRPKNRGQCDSQAPHNRIFRLAAVHHTDLRPGKDYWDYSFTRPGSPVRFLYRVNPGQAPSWGLVRGETDDNVQFSKNKIAGLRSFADTGLARLLDDQADDEGLSWARTGGVATSVELRKNSTLKVDSILIGLLSVVVLGGAVVLIWRRRQVKTE
jgi:hypothetical protein